MVDPQDALVSGLLAGYSTHHARGVDFEVSGDSLNRTLLRYILHMHRSSLLRIGSIGIGPRDTNVNVGQHARNTYDFIGNTIDEGFKYDIETSSDYSEW